METNVDLDCNWIAINFNMEHACPPTMPTPFTRSWSNFFGVGPWLWRLQIAILIWNMTVPSFANTNLQGVKAIFLEVIYLLMRWPPRSWLLKPSPCALPHNIASVPQHSQHFFSTTQCHFLLRGPPFLRSCTVTSRNESMRVFDFEK